MPTYTRFQRANNHGIGHMEQFDYDSAVQDFEDAVSLAPKWAPARINLGIALLSRAQIEEVDLLPAWVPKSVKDKLASLTRKRKEDIEQATWLFQRVLKEEPDNPYAHFCLGLILHQQENIPEAASHFQAVTRIDPSDARAWYCLGGCLPDEDPFKRECFQHTVDLDPYLVPAIHQLAVRLRMQDPGKAQKLLADHAELSASEWNNVDRSDYGQRGRYACVIGGPPAPAPVPRSGPLPLFLPVEDMAGAADAASTPLVQPPDILAHLTPFIEGRLQAGSTNLHDEVLALLESQRPKVDEDDLADAGNPVFCLPRCVVLSMKNVRIRWEASLALLPAFRGSASSLRRSVV